MAFAFDVHMFQNTFVVYPSVSSLMVFPSGITMLILFINSNCLSYLTRSSLCFSYATFNVVRCTDTDLGLQTFSKVRLQTVGEVKNLQKCRINLAGEHFLLFVDMDKYANNKRHSRTPDVGVL